jgi:hypothetical protein
MGGTVVAAVGNPNAINWHRRADLGWNIRPTLVGSRRAGQSGRGQCGSDDQSQYVSHFADLAVKVLRLAKLFSRQLGSAE